MPARDILDRSLIDDYNRQVNSPGSAWILLEGYCHGSWVRVLIPVCVCVCVGCACCVYVLSAASGNLSV